MVINSRRRCLAGIAAIDRGVDDRDVVGRGVAAGTAGAGDYREQFAGVVAPRGEWVKPPTALEIACRAFLVGVRGDQGGVDSDADHAVDVAVGGAYRRDGAVAGRDQRPHRGADLVAGLHEALQGFGVEFVEGAPQRGRRGHRPEQPRLIAEHRDLRHTARAVGDGHRQIPHHRAPVVGHVRPYQGIRHFGGQAGLVGEHSGDHVAGAGHDIITADLDVEPAGPFCCSVHLKGAPVLWISGVSTTPIILERVHFSRSRHPDPAYPHE